jgi:6-phosphogluconolactonase (cycloisomerase 2 family)
MAQFVNINNTAQEFVTPLPFQHFTGDYAVVNLIKSTTSADANVCDAECKNTSSCEFFQFISPNSCSLFEASSTGDTISGIRVNQSLRDVGKSNIYSVTIPDKNPISTTTLNSSNECEASCFNDTKCNVYTYQSTTKTCKLYGYMALLGNVGSSRDIKTFTTQCNYSSTDTPAVRITYRNIGPSSVSMSSDGMYFSIANSGDNTLNVFQRTSPSAPTFRITGLNIPTGSSISGDGTYVAVANGNGGNVQVYQIPSTTPIFTVTGLNVPESVCISNDGNYVAIANTRDGSARVYQRSSQASPIFTVTGLGTVKSVALSSDGTYFGVAYVNGTTGYVNIYQRTSTTVYNSTAVSLITNVVSPNSLCMSSDGMYISFLTGDSTVKMYQRTSPSTPLINIQNTFGCQSVSLSGDGLYLAYVMSSDNSLNIYKRTSPNAPLATITGLIDPRSVSISRDGKYITAYNYSDSSVNIYACK